MAIAVVQELFYLICQAVEILKIIFSPVADSCQLFFHFDEVNRLVLCTTFYGLKWQECDQKYSGNDIQSFFHPKYFLVKND